jgi:hypothetical protein
MSTPTLHPQIPTEIDMQLAKLNDNMCFPTDRPLNREQVLVRVHACDEAIQWFVRHGLPLERRNGVYVLWQPPVKHVEIAG